MPKPRPERAADTARETIDLRIQRTVATIRDSGGVGFQAHTTSAQELAYYKDQIIPEGRLNPEGFTATLDRVGPDNLLEIIAAMERDLAQGQGQASGGT